MITLHAKKNIICSTGNYNPGEVFKCNEKEAAFLIKENAAIEIKPNHGAKFPDSPEKEKAINQAKSLRAKSEKKFSRILGKNNK